VYPCISQNYLILDEASWLEAKALLHAKIFGRLFTLESLCFNSLSTIAAFAAASGPI
jgi:hypothetical protein